MNARKQEVNERDGARYDSRELSCELETRVHREMQRRAIKKERKYLGVGHPR